MFILKTYPNKLRNPNTSTINPIMGYLLNTKNIPPKKHIVPRNFSLRVKKTMVLFGPIIAPMPDKNNIY